MTTTFVVEVDKDVVRRVLAKHLRPRGWWRRALVADRDRPHQGQPMERADLFRCESILRESHWVLVVMDQYTVTGHFEPFFSSRENVLS